MDAAAPASLWSLIGVALLLGIRHGFDADHLAAIDALARLHAGGERRPRLARLSGLLFAAGHGAIVLLAALWLHGRADALPAWLEGAGSLVAALLLLLLGLLNLRLAWRTRGRTDAAAPLALGGWAARALGSRVGGSGLGAMAVGALFALSFDTLAIAAWMGTATLATAGTGGLLWLAVVFVAGMAACDGLNGWWVAGLATRSEHYVARARRAFSLLVAITAIGIASLILARQWWPALDATLDLAPWALSAATIAAVLIGFTLAWRRQREKIGLSAG